MVSYQDIVQNDAVKTYIMKADETLTALGYTEHSFAHVGIVAKEAGRLLEQLGYSAREQELARIAGYLHDIGNVVNRVDHAQSGAVMAFRILDNLQMEPAEIATVIAAIGNHDEKTAFPVNPVAAALILADKSDVRRSRVRSKETIAFDIHDRVNYSVVASGTRIEKEELELHLTIDTQICSVMDYFEIFLERMMLCRKAAEALGLRFRLIVNGQKLL